jgi:hypothetical protein
MKYLIYKWLAVLLLFFSGSVAMAQNINLKFKTACNYSTQCDPFLNNYACAQQIIIRATHGSPRFYTADSSIELRASQTTNGQQLSEGLTFAYLFRAGKKYTIKIKHKGIPSTQLPAYPYLYAGFTNDPPRHTNDGCGLGYLPSIAMDYPQKFTVSKNETTSSFDFEPGTDYFNLWVLTSPLQLDETGVLLISLEIVDQGAPPTNTCYTDGAFDFCSRTWNGSADVRATNPITLNCNAFKTTSEPAAGTAFVRRFTAPSIRLSPGFIAFVVSNSGFAARTLKIIPSADPCNQALRVASGVSNVRSEIASEQPKLENVNIYPSPSNGLVNIQFNRSELLNAEIMVTDQSGRIVYKMRNKSESNLIQLNLQHLSNGIYFIKVNAQNKVPVKKLLISK